MVGDVAMTASSPHNKPVPLSLSDRQLRLVTIGAERVPYAWRHRFLCAVGDELQAKEISNEAVADAVDDVVARFVANGVKGAPVR